MASMMTMVTVNKNMLIAMMVPLMMVDLGPGAVFWQCWSFGVVMVFSFAVPNRYPKP